jgi:hypothetical protein
MMRKLVLALAVAGSALAAATPAMAQYYPHRAPYGYGYGNNRWGDPSEFQRRLYNVRRSLVGVRPDQAYRLNAEASSLQRQVEIAARNGLDPYETQEFGSRIYRLERRLGQAVANRGYGYNGYDRYPSYGYNEGGYRGDRNRYDQDDRWERDDDHDDD